MASNFRAIIFASLILLPQSVFAHAVVIKYAPDSFEVVDKFPDRVEIHFSERVDFGGSSVKVYDTKRNRIDKRDAAVDKNNRRLYSIGLIPQTGDGSYIVEWYITSADDGHVTKGLYAFSLNRRSDFIKEGIGDVNVEHSDILPEVIINWIEFTGYSIVLGLLTLLVAWRGFINDITGREHDIFFQKRFITGISIAILLIFTGIAGYLLIKTDQLQTINETEFFSSLGSAVKTISGISALYRLILAALFGVSIYVFKDKLFSHSRGIHFVILFSIIITSLILRSKVSHAAASVFYPSASTAVMFFHVLSKFLWLGILVASLFVVLPILRKIKSAEFFNRFYQKLAWILNIVFPMICITGMYIIWLHLKNMSNLYITEWGGLLVAMFITGAITFAVRLFNTFLISVARSWVNIILILEMFLGCALLISSSYLSLTTPPYVIEAYSFKLTKNFDDTIIVLNQNPNNSENFLVSIIGKNGHRPGSIKKMKVTLHDHENRLKAVDVEPKKISDHKYIFRKKSLSPPGKWIINISATLNNNREIKTDFNINYPVDIESTRIDTDMRSFAYFEKLNGIGLLLVIIIFSGLLVFIKKNNHRLHSEQRDGAVYSSISEMKEFSIALLVFAMLSGSILLLYNEFGKPEFQKTCEYDGNLWLQSTPIWNRNTLSPNTVTGCTLDIGSPAHTHGADEDGAHPTMYHFASFDEYKYFWRESQRCYGKNRGKWVSYVYFVSRPWKDHDSKGLCR